MIMEIVDRQRHFCCIQLPSSSTLRMKTANEQQDGEDSLSHGYSYKQEWVGRPVSAGWLAGWLGTTTTRIPSIIFIPFPMASVERRPPGNRNYQIKGVPTTTALITHYNACSRVPSHVRTQAALLSCNCNWINLKRHPDQGMGWGE